MQTGRKKTNRKTTRRQTKQIARKEDRTRKVKEITKIKKSSLKIEFVFRQWPHFS